MPDVLIDPRMIVYRLIPDSANYTAVTVEQLQAGLRDIKGSTVITLSALTVPRYRKTGCPYKNNIQKFARVNGFLNFDYQRSVNNQREREGKPADFESLPRQWGTDLNATPFISHVNKSGQHKLYLKFKVQTILSIAYYTLDGQAIPEAVIDPFLDAEEKEHRQGVLKKIVEKDYTVTNIRTVYYKNKGYVIA